MFYIESHLNKCHAPTLCCIFSIKKQIMHKRRGLGISSESLPLPTLCECSEALAATLLPVILLNRLMLTATERMEVNMYLKCSNISWQTAAPTLDSMKLSELKQQVTWLPVVDRLMGLSLTSGDISKQSSLFFCL